MLKLMEIQMVNRTIEELKERMCSKNLEKDKNPYRKAGKERLE